MPEISVIVPVYKVQEFLPACLASLTGQTFRDFELILVDDGSPDECGALCDAWAGRDGRIRVIHKQNGGLSSARNAGLEIARGRYIAFVDSDDLVTADYLEILYNAITREQADMAIGAVEDVDEQGASLPTPALTTPMEEGTFSGRSLLSCLYSPQATYYTVAWNKLYAAGLWKSLRYPEGLNNEDDAVAHRLLLASGRVVCSGRVVYHYRLRPGSICRTGLSPSSFDAADALCDRYEFFVARGLPAELQDRALAACWRRYLSLSAQAGQQPADEALRTRWRQVQVRMRPLAGAAARCRLLPLPVRAQCLRQALKKI